MIRGQAWTTGLAAGLVVGVTLVGCGSREAQGTSRASAVPTVTAQVTEVNPSETVLPAPPASQPLPRDCQSVLTMSEVDTVLGHPLPGTVEFIRGVAEPGIGRTGRVTCRYGVPVAGSTAPSATPSGTASGSASGSASGTASSSVSGSASGRSAAGPTGVPSDHVSARPSGSAAPRPAAQKVVPIEVGLSDYRDVDSAAGRIDFTIHDQQARGAKATDATLLGINGVLLSSRNMSMLTLSYGTLTLALSIDPHAVPTGQVGRIAAALGKAVLRHLRTGTKDHVPG